MQQQRQESTELSPLASRASQTQHQRCTRSITLLTGENLRDAKLIRRLAEVLRKIGNGVGVVTDSAFGEVAQREAFLHALA
jgi:hypothetical protein